ncbi:MAG: ABC transporter substrate-binding protein [Anaerolineae bacterium]
MSGNPLRGILMRVMLLAVLLMLAACAGEAPSGTPSPGETPAELPGTGETAAVEPEATAAGRVLRVAVQPIAQTDPALISSDSEVLIANHVYDYLVDIDAQNQVAPRLATDWVTSADGLIYTFTLASGVTFHDGSPLTAEDVVWTFDRLRDPESGLPTADLYAGIADIAATGDLQVTFTLQQANPFFLYDLSDNHALVLKQGTEDPADLNGTGPYIVDDYRVEDRMVLRANPNYFVEDQPVLDGLEIIFFGDEAAGADALRGGQVDLDMQLSQPLYEVLSEDTSLRTVSIPTNQFDVIRLRSDRAPGNDPRVMEALKLATDRQALFDLVQQSQGAVGRDSPIGPIYEDYYSEDTPVPGRDPQAARELLAAAGYPDGLTMDLYYPQVLSHADLAVTLQQQWAEAGIMVNPISQPESVYYGENGWLEVDLGITGWGHRPYPQFYLEVMLTCDAQWNESHYCDPEFDQLVTLAGTTLDEEERAQAYADIQRILIERGPIVVPYFFARFAAMSPAVEGFNLKAFPGRTDLRAVSLGG